MSPTPLADRHDTLNAHWADPQSRVRVAHYGDPLAEHTVLCNGAAMIDLSDRGKLWVSGPDREALLQSLTTNDVAKQAVGSAIQNAICSNHGKAESLFCEIKYDDHFLLDTAPEVTRFTHDFLEKYTIIRDAKTEDVSDRYAHIGVYGPTAVQGVATAANLAENQLPSAPGELLDTNNQLFVASDESGVAGLDCIVLRDHAAPFWDALIAAGAQPVGREALEIARVEAGRPRFGADVDDTIILLETGLEDRIDYDKGCYVGQETLSRIHFRGGVNRKLMGLLIDGAVPAHGAEVMLDDKVVGTVKSAVMSPTLGKAIALAYLKRTVWTPDTAVTIDGTPATVTALPFV